MTPRTGGAVANSRLKRGLWGVIVIVAMALAVVMLLLVIGAMRDPSGSLHGMLGSALWTTLGPHFVVLSLLALVLSGMAYRSIRGLSILAMVLSIAAVAGSVNITSRIVYAAGVAGGTVNPLSGLWLRSMTDRGPDSEAVFSTVDGRSLKVAIYRPMQASLHAPVLLYIHGGGFKTGSNIETDADLRWFANRGWLVFSVDYRLWTDEIATWDLAPRDIACAAAWVAHNAAHYGGDIARLAVLGDSAGGNLAINYAYAVAMGQVQSGCGGVLPVPKAVVVQYPAVDPLAIFEHGFPVPGFEPEMLVRGYLGGDPYALSERVQASSSYSYLNADAPATLILAPEKDGLVPAWSVYRFADEARLAGVDIELVRIPFANHAYNQLAANSIGNQARRSITARYLNEQGFLNGALN